MNPQFPMLACSSMDQGGGDIAMILLLLVGWGLSGLLALVNLFLIAFLKLPLRFKKINFVGWVFYVVPGIILMLGSYNPIPFGKTPNVIWLAYIVDVPLVITAHFIYLLWRRRRFRDIHKNARRERVS